MLRQVASLACASAAMACASQRLWKPMAPSVDTLAAFLIRPIVVVSLPYDVCAMSAATITPLLTV